MSGPVRLLDVEFAAVPLLAERVAKLAKVAAKLDVEPVTMTLDEPWEVERLESPYPADSPLAGCDAVKVRVKMVTVAIEGASPQLPGGWEFVGAIEHAEAGNLVHGDDPILAQYRSSGPDCNHCRAKRNRRKTVIARSDDGAVVQIGSTCLKDFFGYHGDPEAALRLLDRLVDDIDEIERTGFRGRLGVPTDVFMAVVAAVVRTHGWTPKSMESFRHPSTATVTLYVLGLRHLVEADRVSGLEEKVRAVQVTDEDRAEGEAVREWCRSIPADTTDNYLGNVRVACLGDFLDERHFGIAASAVSARRKAVERAEAKAERDRTERASEFVGEVGMRLDLKVTVAFVREVMSESDFVGGSTYLVTMKDEEGNVLKTFSSGSFGRTAEPGSVYSIRGTVKSHDLYEGRKSTRLSRVAINDNQKGK